MRIIATLVFGLFLTFLLPSNLTFSQEQVNAPTGFTLKSMKFDDRLKPESKPIPTIPKEWRFLAVSNGITVNSNHLWFQDKSGNILMVRAFLFVPEDKCILDPTVYVLNVK